MNGFDLEEYMHQLTAGLQRLFGRELLYVGLQGSWRRGEATKDSDIDVVVVLEQLDLERLERYRTLLDELGNREQSCGFLCGKAELAGWNRLEICLLLHETKDYYGTLAGLVPSYTREDVRDYLKLGVGNLYHGLCHGYLHDHSGTFPQELRQLYRSVFYLLQGLCWLRDGEYPLTYRETAQRLSGPDREVLELSAQMRDSAFEYEFEQAYRLLFLWCSHLLQTL